MCPLKKLQNEAAGRHIWGCVLRTHPHICRPESSTCSFCSGLIYAIFCFLNRRLLVTTKTLLKAIAPAASIGFRKPSAAAGIKITL